VWRASRLRLIEFRKDYLTPSRCPAWAAVAAARVPLEADPGSVWAECGRETVSDSRQRIDWRSSTAF